MASRSHRPEWLLAGLSWLVEYAIALVFWFLLVAKLELHELLVGAIAAAVAATASHVVRRQHVIDIGAHARDFAQVVRLPRYAIEGTWEVLSVLMRQLAGCGEAQSLLREVPFDVGEADDRRAATRRALACAYTSMTPNFLVLGFDVRRGRMIFHQVRWSSIPEMTKRLGARP